MDLGVEVLSVGLMHGERIKPKAQRLSPMITAHMNGRNPLTVNKPSRKVLT